MNKLLKELLISLAAGVLTFLFGFLGLFNRIDYVLTDAVYQRPVVPNTDIKIIAIDEKSMAELGAYKTWSRQLYADLLNQLYDGSENEPQVVVFDLILQGNTDEEADIAFAEAAKAAGSVVCAENLVFKPAIEVNAQGKKYLNRLHVQQVEKPYPELLDSVRLGFANTINDSTDSVVRDFFPTLFDGEEWSNSLAMTAAKLLNEKGSLDIKIPDTKSGESLMIRYTGKPGDYEALSFSDVLSGRIPREAFRNSIVFVGAYAPGMMDAYSVPTSHATQMYGVEIHANILESIAEGRYMQRKGSLPVAIVYAFVVMLFMFLAQRVSLLISGIASAVIIAAQIITGLSFANNHRYLPLITLVICLVLGYISVIVMHYVAETMQKRKVLKAFRQYVSPEVVEAIAKKGDFEVKLGGQKRDIAVLFVDIRGFTTLSESLQPEQVVEILNEYLALTTQSIFNNMGTLDKFVGDATMGVFNSPFDLDDYIYKAVHAAWDIVAGSDAIREKALELTGKTVGFGVGVNCGDAVVGNIGCDFRMDYTAIGDTVNTAARLEANAKAGQVLLSQSVIDALGDRIEVKPVGEIPLKGKSIPLMVYELIDIH